MLIVLCYCVSICRATTAQTPPSSGSFRALLEEEENRLIRLGQTGVKRGRNTQGSPITLAPAARRVTFKCEESSESERPVGWVQPWVNVFCHNANDCFCAVPPNSTGWSCCTSFVKLLSLNTYKVEDITLIEENFWSIFFFSLIQENN